MYTWIVITGGVFSFLAAMGIGANDVANAYATAIGSKALTMKQAVFLAMIFESSGAILMGSHVTNTIRKGIADYECFEDDPGSLMYGCMWVCLSVGAWLFIASKYEMPVSTTHSCVGGMIGMTLALKGPDCVIWYEDKDTFPFVGGVSGIILSWIVSPVFSAIISCLLFYCIRSVILRNLFSFKRTGYLFPVLIGTTITLNSFLIIYKGAKGLGLDDTPFDVACAWSFGIGTFSALCILPLSKRIQNYILNTKQIHTNTSIQNQDVTIQSIQDTPNQNKFVKYINNNFKINLNNIISDDSVVESIHQNAEVFDQNTEYYFRYLQIFTAMCDSFSHGANDVANAIGPFAAIYTISRDMTVSKKNELGDSAYWILTMGGVGISFGLLLYGYKIIQAIGLKLCKITPSRGATIELASSIVIISGSRLEIPLSTTHCQIGATLGVAALENPKTCSGMNMKIIMKTIIGWVITLIIVGSTSAILTAQGSYAPEINVSPC